MIAVELQAVTEAHKHVDDVRLPAYSVHMDAIRSVAAFLVLAGHARMLFFGSHEGQGSTDGTVRDLGLGHHAVIVFFVLSGFLVGNSAWRAASAGRWSWGKYLLQRMTRLWIVLLPALIIGGCLDHVGMRFLPNSIYAGPAGQAMVAPDLPSASTLKTFAGNAVFLQTIHVANYGTNAALWSLANEFWYYMAFPPLLLLFLGRKSVTMKFVYLALAAAVLIFVGKSIAVLFIVWLLGFAVSRLPLKIPDQYRRPVTIACLLQFLAVNGLLRMHPIAVLRSDGLLGLSFALFLYSLVHAQQPVKSVAYQHTATHLSRFSYSLYLLHLPFLTFLTALLIRPWHPWRKDPVHLAIAILLVVAAYGYAWLLSLVFERNTDRVRGSLTRLLA